MNMARPAGGEPAIVECGKLIDGAADPNFAPEPGNQASEFCQPQEIYGDIKGELAKYKVPPFDAALKALSDVVKAKKGGNDYAKALKTVNDALTAADAGMKSKASRLAGIRRGGGGRGAQGRDR